MNKFLSPGRWGKPAFTLWLSMFLAASAATVGCKKDKPSASPEEKSELPTLRIYALSGAAGAIEPCGCVKDMLGGIDHAAAYIESQRKNAPHSLVLGAGPMFFENPHLEASKKDQQLYKAEAMAQSLSDLGLFAWSPGANDWAPGESTFVDLKKKTGALAIAANLEKAPGIIASTQITRGGVNVGLIGISLPKSPTGEAKVAWKEPESTLIKELKQLQGTDLNIALISAPRGAALRWIEKIAQLTLPLQLAILGKPYDQGENNDPPFAPEVINQTLVVQAPNHLQAVSVIDLHVRDGSMSFIDGTGLSIHEKKTNLGRRIDELSRRIERWEAPDSQVKKPDIVKQQQELDKLRAQLRRLKPTSVPSKGSYFLYDLVLVREGLGQSSRVTSRMDAYYRRVNEHNKEVFADRKPPPAQEDEASYVGVETCGNCHIEERAFWNKTPHARAYSTLEVAHKEFNLDCVSCHVTGYEQPGGSSLTEVDGLKSVQCEVCHGPGSLHAENPGEKGAIRQAPSRNLCASSCHHPPHVGTDWSVEVAWPQIIGKGHGR